AAGAVPYSFSHLLAPGRAAAERNYLRPPGALEDDAAFVAACVGYGLCGELCPPRCIRFHARDGGGKVNTPYIDPEQKACILCDKCMKVCPTESLTVIPRTRSTAKNAPISTATSWRSCWPWSGAAHRRPISFSRPIWFRFSPRVIWRPTRNTGEPGFVTIVQSLVREWTDSRDAILSDAEMIRGQLRGLAEPAPSGPAGGRGDPRESAVRAWSAAFDTSYGGFGGGPKFLRPNVLSFLLRRGTWRRDAALLENVFRTLDHMAAGGVRDQLGGACHRYAVDRFWQVPHFEIMLDQNALLARLYLEAYQASIKHRYAAVARGILDQLLARFRLPGGGFAASLDAGTETTEGLYYAWTADEVRSVLGAARAEPFIEAYVEQSHGLVRGRSVLRLLDNPESLLNTEARLAASWSRLRDARAERATPRRAASSGPKQHRSGGSQMIDRNHIFEIEFIKKTVSPTYKLAHHRPDSAAQTSQERNHSNPSRTKDFFNTLSHNRKFGVVPTP
ncbi:MAG: hypothetical protein V3U99_06020, partial [Alphaproteobacteria bacterium]